MAQEVPSKLVIEEQPQKTTGARPHSAARFEWDATHFSAPRGPWEYTVKVRTARFDYPSAEIPTEQVLGSNFEPFTLSGIWDDKHNGGTDSRFSETTRTEFEAMVRRGNLVKFDFEGIHFTGLITQFTPRYFTKHRCGYSFVVSPHYHDPNGDVRADAGQPAKFSDSPSGYDQKIRDIIARAKAAIRVAPAVYFVGATLTNVSNTVDSLVERSAILGSVVASRVLSISTTADSSSRSNPSLARFVQAAQSIQSGAQDLLTLTRSIQATATGALATLAYDDAANAMALEDFIRSMRMLARELVLMASQAAQDLASLIAPDAMALYAPHAGESLYGISTRFYNTPHRWREIYDRNGLVSMVLAGTELLVIPLNGIGL